MDPDFEKIAKDMSHSEYFA
jgi:hypothetical protein